MTIDMELFFFIFYTGSFVFSCFHRIINKKKRGKEKWIYLHPYLTSDGRNIKNRKVKTTKLPHDITSLSILNPLDL